MKRAELAKSQILNYATEDEGSITVDEEMCQIWWEVFNHAMFNGELNEPVRFECGPFINHWGWCLPWRKNSNTRRVRIGIHTGLTSFPTLLRTIAHESIHQWEWEIDKQPWNNITEHGPSFQNQAQNFLDELGMDVLQNK